MKRLFFALAVALAAVSATLTTTAPGSAASAQDATNDVAPPAFALQYGDGPADLSQFAVSETKIDKFSSTFRYVAPDGKLQIEFDVEKPRRFAYKAVAVSARLTNLSTTEPTDVVRDFRVYADSLPLDDASKSVRLNALRGSVSGPQDFSPIEIDLAPGAERSFNAPGGRSSNDFLPFVEANFDERRGVLIGVGWTGDWLAKFANVDGKLNVEVGMERCALALNPGESILQPSVLIFNRKNQTRREFKTVVHRYMREEIAPRDASGAVIPPILAITAAGGNKTPEMMLDILKYNLDNDLGCDAYWIDAGWHGAPHKPDPLPNCGWEWFEHTGDWRVNTGVHPTGDLLPIADAVHKAGMKFLLWFEPERVQPSAPIMRTRPEYVRDRLLNYADPDALKYIKETVYGVIAKHGVDVYRQDFAIDPTATWAALESEEGPNRVGIVEAKHVAGMYSFLDEMRERFPNILLENCASGGRRIDFEMVKRAHSYCRSDYFIGPKGDDSAFILGQNATLNTTPYLPFQGSETDCVSIGDDYGFMSAASSGTVFTPTDFGGGIITREFTADETAWFKKMFGWARRLKDYYLGDFYQLTDETGPENDVWCGWSLNRPETNDGFALIFRRADAPDAERTFELPAIDPTAKYEVEYFDGTKATVDGEDLATLKVELAPRSFFLVVYKKIG